MLQTEIEIYFGQMEALSEELLEIAEELSRTVAAEGMETISGTKSSWISAKADVFAGKEVKLFERVEESAMNFRNLSEEIYSKAKQIYESEQQNALMAKARSYR